MTKKYSEITEKINIHLTDLRLAGKMLSESWDADASDICRAYSDKICFKISELCDEIENLKKQEDFK